MRSALLIPSHEIRWGIYYSFFYISKGVIGGRLFEVWEVFGDPWGSYGVMGILKDQRGS